MPFVRRIIQIAAIAEGEEEGNNFLYALANDHTLWVMRNAGYPAASPWQRISGLPQPPNAMVDHQEDR